MNHVIFEDYRKEFLSELNVEMEKYVPIFAGVVSKREIWFHGIEPRIQQFRMEIENVIEYPVSSLRQSNKSPVPMLDSSLIEIMNGLHSFNCAVYQIAVVLLGEEELSNRSIPIPAIDLDALVRPYLIKWLENQQNKLVNIVERCVSNDTEDVEDENLNVSSSSADLFAYLQGMLGVYFSLPGSAFQRMLESMDDLSKHSLSPASNNPSHPLRGVFRALRENLFHLLNSSMDAVESYAEHLLSPRNGVHLADPAFHVFNKRRRKKIEIEEEEIQGEQGMRRRKSLRSCEPSSPIGIEHTVKLYRRLNNLSYAKHLLNVFEDTVRKKSQERGAYPVPDGQQDEASIWRSTFDRGHIALNRSLICLTNYVAKRLVYVDLKTEFVDGLYANAENIGSCSLHTISGMIKGAIEDVFDKVRADQYLLHERRDYRPVGDSVAHHVLLAFFKHLLDAYEAIVITDPHAGRKFQVADASIIMDDISLLESIFSRPRNNLEECLPAEAVSVCLKPLRAIVTSLYRLPTTSLVHMYEALVVSEKKAKERKAMEISGSTEQRIQRTRMPSVLTIKDMIEELELEEAKQREYNGKIESQDLAASDLPFHSIVNIVHSLTGFASYSKNPTPGSNDTREKAATKRESVKSTSSNPFLSVDSGLIEAKITSAELVNVIARRAGYGNPLYFRTRPGEILGAANLIKKGANSDCSKENDQVAFMFMKKYGMKRWLNKRTEMAEGMVGKARDKIHGGFNQLVNMAKGRGSNHEL